MLQGEPRLKARATWKQRLEKQVLRFAQDDNKKSNDRTVTRLNARYPTLSYHERVGHPDFWGWAPGPWVRFKVKG